MPGCVVTIGFFDGVHRGHRLLIEQVRGAAAARGLESVVITFLKHPREVLQPGFHPELLTTCREKTELLASLGIDRCVLLDFSPRLAQLTAHDFMAYLQAQYDAKVLVVGHDHRFGHNRSEGFDDYVRYGAELGMEVLHAGAYYYTWNGGMKEELPVSSSRIRECLHAGDVEKAALYLGRSYTMQGKVESGRGVGHTIGFPTANIEMQDADKLVPADGVYAVMVEINGQRHGGMVNIGHHPTFGEDSGRTIEAHLFDFNADIYNRPIQLAFVSRLRSEQKFATVEALVQTLHEDEARARSLLKIGLPAD